MNFWEFTIFPIALNILPNIYVSNYFSENRVVGRHLVVKMQVLLGLISPHLGYNLKQVFNAYIPQEISSINSGSVVLITQLLDGCTTYLSVSFRLVINTWLLPAWRVRDAFEGSSSSQVTCRHIAFPFQIVSNSLQVHFVSTWAWYFLLFPSGKAKAFPAFPFVIVV